MKVLIINTVNFQLNGITSVIMNYYRSMDKEDMQIDFVVINEISEEFRQELTGSGAAIFHLPRRQSLPKYLTGLYRLLKNGRYDIVHIHGNSAMLLADMLPIVLAGVPVRIVHSHNTQCDHMKLHKLLLPIFGKTYTHALACGEAAGQWLFPGKPFLELKNGIDLKQYAYDSEARSAFREKLHAGSRKVIGHVGNFITQKNHGFLIDAFARLVQEDPSYLLVLISDGPLMDSIREKVSVLGIGEHVQFIGRTTEVFGYLQAMDVMVLPSLHEGLPVILIEAQAAGLPCLVADTVSREADLTDSLQFLPIDDPAVWAKAMAARAAQTEHTDRAAVCARWQQAIADAGYDVTRNAGKLKQLYRRYLNAKRRR